MDDNIRSWQYDRLKTVHNHFQAMATKIIEGYINAKDQLVSVECYIH